MARSGWLVVLVLCALSARAFAEVANDAEASMGFDWRRQLIGEVSQPSRLSGASLPRATAEVYPWARVPVCLSVCLKVALLLCTKIRDLYPLRMAWLRRLALSLGTERPCPASRALLAAWPGASMPASQLVRHACTHAVQSSVTD